MVEVLWIVAFHQGVHCLLGKEIVFRVRNISVQCSPFIMLCMYLEVHWNRLCYKCTLL